MFETGYQRLKRENSRLLGEELARGATTLRALPEIVTLNSTDICNLRCVMCPRNLAQGTFRLEDRVVRFVADELFPTALKANLTTAGGEPLGPGFGTILENARRYEVLVDVVTNAQLLDRDTFAEMRPLLDHLNVSVDCAVPEVYERLRLGGSFDRLVDNLRAVSEARSDGADDILFSMSAVVMASNLPHLAGLVRFAADHGAGGVVLQRLRHEIKPTWEEDAPSHFSPAEIEGHLDRAAEAARELGLNLYQAELGRPNLFHREQRPKVPDTRDDAGVCYFLSQSFSVMYTGEVYPCCKPTDYKLGDVRFESPVEIWNGAPLRRLREAHHARRGTLFCSGCEYAPHLPARTHPRLDEGLRRGRRAVAHVANKLVRGARERWSARAYDADRPAFDRCEARISTNGLPPLRATPLTGRREASAVHPGDGAIWYAGNGALWRCPDPRLPGVPVVELEDAGEASCFVFVDSRTALVSCAGSGRLLRVEVGSSGPRIEVALELSDPRSCVRTGAVAPVADGTVWVGEYGTFPGARCARVYRSRDGARRFELVHWFRRARHVHALACPPRDGRPVVTTGDLPAERRTYVGVGSRPRFRAALGPWAGFTAIAFSEGFVHFGTDLHEENGLLRTDPRLSEPVEYRALQGALDLQVRQIEHLGGGRLVALGRLDDDLGDLRRARPATLLWSEDHGSSWTAVHRFEESADDAPERFVALAGEPRIVTDGTSTPCLLELPR